MKRAHHPYLHLFQPKLWTTLRSGYGLAELRRDLFAGLTVAIVALPLAMALAIASGSTPEKGLHTAIVAGFLISALGGSRVQIGGPTGAFIPVVFAIIAQHGYDGLLLATLMAGVILVIGAVCRLGALMRYMPQPVITGFTTGIAVIIFSSQLKDLLGLQMGAVPAGFLPTMTAVSAALPTFGSAALGLSAACLAALLLLRRFAPRLPAFLLVVLAASVAVAWLALPVETIGSRFGAIPSGLPQLALPDISLERLRLLLPSAFTIAFLAGIESLLSAVVADGMTGGRHRPNAELLAQGVANIASSVTGGLPATGAIARTAVNVRAGANSPVAGIAQALYILLFMLLLTDWMGWVPLPALAAILTIVAWNMAELKHFRHGLRAPVGDRVVLVLTFALTVLFDLTVAIEAGMVVAAFTFMHRMARTVEIETQTERVAAQVGGDDEAEGEAESSQRDRLPPDVEAFRIDGPLFFGVSTRLDDMLDQFPKPPRVFILRMSRVPLIDASGVHALNGLLQRCRQRRIELIISGLRPRLRRLLHQMHLHEQPGTLRFAVDFDEALQFAAAAAPLPAAAVTP